MKLAAAAMVLAAAACSNEPPARIDGSSRQSFEHSSAKARQQLPDRDRLAFDRALRTISGRRHSERDPAALARRTFDGMTGAEVVADQRARER